MNGDINEYMPQQEQETVHTGEVVQHILLLEFVPGNLSWNIFIK